MHAGSVTFSTELDNAQLEKDLFGLTKKIEKQEQKVADLGSKRDKAKKKGLFDAATLDAEKAKLQEIKDRLADIRAISKEKSLGAEQREGYAAQIPAVQQELKDQQVRVNALQSEWNKTENAVDRYTAQLEEAEMILHHQKEEAGYLVQQIEAGNRSEANSGAAESENRMKEILGRMREYFDNPMRSTKALFEEFFQGVTRGFVGLGQDIGSVAKKIPEFFKRAFTESSHAAKNLTSFVKKAAKSVVSLFKSSNKTNSSFASGIKKMLLYSVGIRSLYALTNKLRTALTDGLKNLAQFSSSTNASISMMKSALTQLKNSIATAFAPILTVVAPLITQFINMVSAAANAVARLTAMLTGQKSYAKAIAVQEDYAASLEGTASAADEAAGSLAGFDEINTIATENTASGGGAGAGEVAPSEMFEMVEVEPLSFDSWGEAFSVMLSSILDIGIPKLKEGLTSLAGWINAFSANLYEMFTFPGVYDKVVAIGVELANALNDFVNLIDWATLGGALGAGLNLALGFLVSFLYTFNWMNLGAKLAEMVNNAVAEIDWENVGKLLWARFKIALETLAGFILGLDMPELAQAAGDIVIGFFDSMTETLRNIDWFALGEQTS